MNYDVERDGGAKPKSDNLDNRHNEGDPVEHLHRAEHDLERALEKSREAAGDVARAETEVEVAIEEMERPRKFTVKVLYNGVVKTFEVRAEETVKHLLDEAIRAFGAVNPHTLSLYKEGKELADEQTLKAAGVEPNDQLLLRPSAVKGGGS
jgi:chromosome segregation ATPase